MFASLKNKIKEETGNDVAKLAPILSSPPQKGSSRHSRQGSGSSVGSISLDGLREDGATSPTSLSRRDSVDVKLAEGKVLSMKEIKRLEKREDDWKRAMQKREEEWKRQMERQEEEWKKEMETKENEWKRSLELLEKEKIVLEEEKREVVKQKLSLEEALKVAEEYKKKVYQYQEDMDQLEGFQTQEMAKIKHLLLVTEQEVTEKTETLKEVTSQVESLKLEVNRLRRYEEELSRVQDELESIRHSSDLERSRLKSDLARAEEETRHLTERISLLEARATPISEPDAADDPDGRVRRLLAERAAQDARLEEAHLQLTDIKASWSARIAQLETQLGRLCRQAAEEGAERRRAEGERDALLERIRALEVLLEQARSTGRQRDETLAAVRQERDELAAEIREMRAARQELEQKLAAHTKSAEEERERAKEYQIEAERRIAELESKCADLLSAVDNEKTTSTSLQEQIMSLEGKLSQSEERTAELLSEIHQEKSEKDVAQLRCAELNQQCELVRQQLREQQRDAADIQTRVGTLQNEIEIKDKEIGSQSNKIQELLNRVQALELIEHDKHAAEKQEQELRRTILDLEEQVAEKNKSVRVLQQRLGDMKKTLQRELRNPSHDTGDSVDVIPSGQAPAQGTGPGPGPGPGTSSSRQPPPIGSEDDVNFKYLKHVLMKFLTSREYEAQHLTRAVATLLHFTPEEERLLRETLEWKMSWFGTRPSLGYGQMSKTIPPS
ncbi:golgin subfamily A member 1 [Schistocerca americana]|uniref:golgin subfamily A member 1 n=1 Tax=Schistocerca americana TaxID=7009 RepID=UPI001F4F7EAC|nr:golgin subfamily A member 1 [Schistocerca americana]XP_049959775.1 golgin subfamily A member 1 isoform X1 [Schistocerca serialis cubense]